MQRLPAPNLFASGVLSAPALALKKYRLTHAGQAARSKIETDQRRLTRMVRGAG